MISCLRLPLKIPVAVVAARCEMRKPLFSWNEFIAGAFQQHVGVQFSAAQGSNNEA